MGKWTKTAGLLFLAAASVYSSQAIVATVGTGATPASRAKAPVWPESDGTHVALADHSAPGTTSVAPIAPVSDRIYAAPDNSTDVKVLDDSSDPFANAPATQPTAVATDAPATQPSAGRSVSSSEVSVSDAGTVEIH